MRRFDRGGAAPSGPTDRVSYLSAQSFIGANVATGGFYTDIADTLRMHGASPKTQLAELSRRILFTILVSNSDDHLRNHGLLHDGDGLCCRPRSTSTRSLSVRGTLKRVSAN